MSYASKNRSKVVGAIIGMVAVALMAVWQFYLFVTFESDAAEQSGSSHLWWAIIMATLACAIGFLVFSVFVRHDSEDDLHITSAPVPAHLAPKAPR